MGTRRNPDGHSSTRSSGWARNTPRFSSTSARSPIAWSVTSHRVSSEASPNARVRAAPDLQAEHAPDDLLHDLGAPAADRAEPSVAPRSLHGKLHHVAVSPVDLQALVGHLPRELRGEPLGHRYLHRGVLPGDDLTERVVRERPGGLDLGGGCAN